MAQFKRTPAHAIEGLEGLNLAQLLVDHQTRIIELKKLGTDHESRLTDLELRPHGELEAGGHLATQIKSDADVNTTVNANKTLEDYLEEIRRARGGFPDLAARLSALSGRGFVRTWTFADDFLDAQNTLTRVAIEKVGVEDASLSLGSVIAGQKSLVKDAATQWQRSQPKNLVLHNALNSTNVSEARWIALRFAPVQAVAVRMVVYANGGFRTAGNSQLGLAEMELRLADAVVTPVMATASSSHKDYPAANLIDGIATPGAVTNSWFSDTTHDLSPQKPVMVMLSLPASGATVDTLRFVHTSNNLYPNRQPRMFEIQFTTDLDAQVTDDPRSPRWFGLDLSNGLADGSEKAYADEAKTLEATLTSLPGFLIKEGFEIDARPLFSSALTLGTLDHAPGNLLLGNGTTNTVHGFGIHDLFRDGSVTAKVTTGTTFSATESAYLGLQVRGYGAHTLTTGKLGYLFKIYNATPSVNGGTAYASLQYWSGTAWVNAVTPALVQGLNFSPNITYTLKIEAQGNVLKCFVDGVQVISWTDSFFRHMTGQVSMAMRNMNAASVDSFEVESSEAPYGQRVNVSVSDGVKLAQTGGAYFTSGRWVSEPILLTGKSGAALSKLNWLTEGSGITLSYRTARAPKTQPYRNVALANNGGSVKITSGHTAYVASPVTNLIQGIRGATDPTTFFVDLRSYTTGTGAEKVAALFTFETGAVINKITHVNQDIWGAKKVKVWAGVSEVELQYLGEYDLTTYAGPGSNAARKLYVDDIRFAPIYAQMVRLEWTPNPNRISGSFAAGNFNDDYLSISAVEIYSDAMTGLDRATYYQVNVADLEADLNRAMDEGHHWVQLRADLAGNGSETPKLSRYGVTWDEGARAASGSAILRMDSGANDTRYNKASFLLSDLRPGVKAKVSYRTGNYLDPSQPWTFLAQDASNFARNVAYAGNGGQVYYLGNKTVSSAQWSLYRLINGVDAFHTTDMNALNLAQYALGGAAGYNTGNTAPVQEFLVELDSPYELDGAEILQRTQYGAKEVTLSYSAEDPKRETWLAFESAGQAAFRNVDVNVAASGHNTVEFDMTWTGTGSIMPFGWNTNYDLMFEANGAKLGFNTGNSDSLGFDVTPFKDKRVHVTAVFYNGVPSESEMAIYVDGVKQELIQTGAPVARSATKDLFLSGWGADAAYRFKGLLSNLRVWSRKLTDAEVALYAASGVSGNEPGLVGWWPIKENAGSVLFDKTANQRHGSFSGSYWTTSSLMPTALIPIGSYALRVSETVQEFSENLIKFEPVRARWLKYAFVPNRMDHMDLIQLKAWSNGVPLSARGRYFEMKLDMEGSEEMSPKLQEASVDYQIDPTAATEKSVLGLAIDLERARFEFQSYKQRRQYNLATEVLDFLLDDTRIAGWDDERYPIYDAINKYLVVHEARRLFGATVTMTSIQAAAGKLDDLVLMTNAMLLGGKVTVTLEGKTGGANPSFITRSYEVAEGISAIRTTDFVGCVEVKPSIRLTGSSRLKSWGIVHR